MATTSAQPPSSQASASASALESILLKTLSKQHNWTSLTLHPPPSPSTSPSPLPLPLLSGLPPTRLYTSPTAQAHYLRTQSAFLATPPQTPEEVSRRTMLEKAYFAPVREFVAGCWKNAGGSDSSAHGVSMARIAATFELMDAVVERGEQGRREGGEPPRLVLGIVDSDSTVVFYVLHDGIVKARQN